MKFIWRDDSGKGRSLENLMGERNFMKKMVFIRAMWVENDESKGFFFCTMLEQKNGHDEGWLLTCCG